MKVLAVDTSSKACSCALLDGGALLGESFLNAGLTHSSTLMPLVGQTLSNARLNLSEIDLLAVSVGPGSYTGLRIGLSAVKGMAAARQTPCVGVSTLLSLAYNLAARDGIICAVLDARAGQVFAALFENRGGEITRLTPDEAMTLEALERTLPCGAMAVGDGAALCAERLMHKNLALCPAALRYQRASSVGYAAMRLPPGDAAALTPDYHRKPQAQREREARERNQGVTP